MLIGLSFSTPRGARDTGDFARDMADILCVKVSVAQHEYPTNWFVFAMIPTISKCSFGERLCEERKRAGLTQAAFAALGGVTPKTQVLYEKSERIPDANYLAALGSENFDVLYILMGQRAANALSVEESALLTGYRNLDQKARVGVLALMGGIQPESVRRVKVQGDVGQLVEGDLQVSAPLTINMGKKRKN